MNNKVIFLVLLFFLSCSSQKDIAPKRDFRANMRDAQKLTTELFNYVWDEKSFVDQKNAKKISELLNELSADFHEIKKAGNSLELEPGFDVILTTQRELIKDIATRFNEDQKDYALWRLKGMSQNCIACHSRLNVSYDFFGEVEAAGVKGTFTEAEFLFASRKFDLASEKFLEFAKKASTTQDLAFNALKYWMLIEVRVKGRFSELDSKLNDVLKSGKFNKEHQEIIKHWLSDLPKVQLLKLNSLLVLPSKQETIEDEEKEFLTNITITSLLHGFLDANPLTNKRKKALLNLGATYLDLTIPSLAVFGPMYLEHTIREFPNTNEAKAAFELYKNNLELENTGSSGVNLDQEQKNKLKELEKMAG